MSYTSDPEDMSINNNELLVAVLATHLKFHEAKNTIPLFDQLIA